MMGKSCGRPDGKSTEKAHVGKRMTAKATSFFIEVSLLSSEERKEAVALQPLSTSPLASLGVSSKVNNNWINLPLILISLLLLYICGVGSRSLTHISKTAHRYCAGLLQPVPVVALECDCAYRIQYASDGNVVQPDMSVFTKLSCRRQKVSTVQL